MRFPLFAATAAAALALGPTTYVQALSQTLSPALQAQVESGYQGNINVIVKFAQGVDFRQLGRDVNRLLKQQYPDPKVRKAARKAVKRSELLKAFKRASKGNAQAVAKHLRAKGIPTKVTDLWITNSVAVEVPVSLLPGIAALPGVEAVYLDAVVEGPVTSTVPAAPTYWNLDMTGAPVLWELGHTGLGVVVATMDTGADASHPDLGSSYRDGTNSWFDPYGENLEPADSNGHGTQVLGLMVARSDTYYQVGMAPDSQWIAAKIFDNANRATLSAIHAAFQWLLDPDGDPATRDAPDIVNNSWALNGTQDQCLQEFAPDIAALKEAEIAVVFAAGNYGPDYATSVSPANDPAAVSVGAVDYYANVDYLSSRGPGACDGGIYPHLVAPGDAVLTTDRMGYYTIVSGTSFAAPHVSGAMALLMGAFPDATISQIETALKEHAVDIGDAGPDNDSGHGLIDVLAAFQQLEAELGGGGGVAGTFDFSSTTYSVDENVAGLAVTVTRSGGAVGVVSVDFAADLDPYAIDPAAAGVDFLPMADTLVFADGVTSRTISVSILDDSLTEADEDFRLSLSNPQGGAILGSIAEAVATILDDDLPAAPVITSMPAAEATVNALYEYQVTATDADGDPITFALDLGPAAMAMDGAGLVTWTPTLFDLGDHAVIVSASDGSLTSTQEYTLGVLPAGDGTEGPLFFTNLADLDIHAYDGSAYSTVLSFAATMGFAANIDGLHMVDADTFYVSFANTNVTVPGIGTMQDEDVLLYDAGTWSLYFDGTARGLTSDDHDVDGVSIVGGTLYFSTLGNANVGGLGAADDADIYSWDGSSFSRVFDASAAGLSNNADIDGLTVKGTTYYMSFNRNGGTNVPGLGTVQDEAVVSYDGSTWSMYFSGPGLDASDQLDLDAVHVP